MKKDLEEKLRIIQQLKPIDDDFFEKLAEDKEVCEEILRVIMEDPALKVIEVIPQGSIKNLQGRSVRLDALCELGDGSRCNIEVQKSDNDNHFRRVHYNGSCITANITDPGEKFEKVPDVYEVYISRFDIMKKGKTIYHVDPVVRESGQVIDNGYHEIYVNTKIDDGSEIAELMQCFEQEQVTNAKFPKLANRVSQFKGSEKGDGKMCSLIQEYVEKKALEMRDDIWAEVKAEVEAVVKEEVKAEVKEEVKAEVKEEVKAEVKEEVKAEIVKNMLKKGLTCEEVSSLTRISLEQVNMIKQTEEVKEGE